MRGVYSCTLFYELECRIIAERQILLFEKFEYNFKTYNFGYVLDSLIFT